MVADLHVGTQATIRNLDINQILKVGDDGTDIAKILLLIGTLPAIAAVGSGATAVATITGVASAGIAVGDRVTGQPLAAFAGHLGLGGFFVPTTNVVNAYIQNTKPDSAGSLIPKGIALTVIRVGS